MNRHSLSSKITFVFAVSFVLVCVLFILLFKFQIERNLDLTQKRQIQSLNYLLQQYKNKARPKNLELYFNFFGFEKVNNNNLAKSIIERGEKVFARESAMGFFGSLLYNNKYYLFISIRGDKKQYLFENVDNNTTTDHLWIGFILAIGVLISTYISIRRSFYPLQTLSKNIRKFASGDMNIEYKSNKKDEIAEVANEFDKAVKKIKHLVSSRQLFLRNIMHELKTPIGKGRIVSEMVHDDVQKQRLISIFERLDLLINEFSKIEQLVSSSYHLQVSQYPISSLLEQAQDLLMLDKEQIENNILNQIQDDLVIEADFDLMSLAIKNLLDNALKYSQNKKVTITNINNGIRFANDGKPLSYSIEHYFGAFINDKNSSGLGLGLYIIKNILDYHEYKLAYSYQGQTHCFDILWENENEK